MAEVQGDVGEHGRTTRDMLAQSGDDAYRQARSALASAVEDQKHNAARGLGDVARSMHEMARSLTNENHEIGARYTDLAADQIERAARALESRTIDDLMSEVESFARRQPAMFLGGAAAAGFVLARFLKSSDARTRGYDSGAYSAGSSPYRPAATARMGEEDVPGGGI